MKIPSTTSTACSTSVWVAEMCTLNPTSTAAAPTKLWSRAMSSGIPVISTLRAFHVPMTAPMAIAPYSRAAEVQSKLVPAPGWAMA